MPPPDRTAYRTNLARLISPLRRVRARVPFYQLAAHRIPTLWSLYRGLLSAAPSDHVRSSHSIKSASIRDKTGRQD